MPPIRHPTVRLSSVERTKLKSERDDDSRLEISLQSNETVTIVGEYGIQVLSGIITVYGCVLRTNSGVQRIYAPSTQALPQLQARQDNTSVRITSVKSGLRKLDRLSPLFRNIWTSNERSLTFLETMDDDPLQRSLTALELDKETETVLRTLSAKVTVDGQKPRIMAIGAKSSGKSTFDRLLYNHMHSWTQSKTCSYLDLDPGQPEFGPPAQLSLVEVTSPIFGPPFTHPAPHNSKRYELVRSHTIAATSFKEDPELYKACAADLVEYADKRYPLIVNSCGWVTGAGASILVDLISILEISDIVLLEPIDLTLAESLQSQSSALTVHRISRRPPKSSSRTPAENRAMQTMAYFHQRPQIANGLPKWSAKPIDTVRPWIVGYGGPDSGIFAIMSYGQSPDPKFLAEVLDGSVVAIVVLADHADASLDLAEHIRRTSEGLPYIEANTQGVGRTIDPATSHCIGLALIRSIDSEAQALHLVTPWPESQIHELMDKRVVLVRGHFDPPEWAYLEDLYKADGGIDEIERPWVARKDMGGIEGAVWRLRHPPMASSVSVIR